MKIKSLLLLLLGLVFLSAATPSYSLKHQMLSDLFFLKNLSVVKYAPFEWKKSHCGWDLDLAYEEAKNKILKLQNPTVKEYQCILKKFTHSFKDYHVGVQFLSMEEAYLPFTLRGANGRYFIVHVDHKKIALEKCSVGDEILEFNGEPIASVIEALKKTEVGNSDSQTDQATAELTFTYRRGEVGDRVPQGKATFLIRRNKTLALETLETEWCYDKEKINNIDLLKSPAQKNGVFEKNFCNCAYRKEYCAREKNNFYAIGNKKSFIPSLGKKVWVEDNDRLFHSYIFELPLQDRVAFIGYIRLPHYYSGKKELEQLTALIQRMEESSDALIIDQINNPGGSLFYLYAIASLLTDKPLLLPKHQIALTQEEIYDAAHMLHILEKVKDDSSAKKELGEQVHGYPIDYKFVKNNRRFCELVINEWNSGKYITSPTHLFGVEEIEPHSVTRYTKPILMLINCLDFSGGDFLPAILRDNECVTLLGETTAGAGGYVLEVQYPNILGINSFYLTGSLALRSNNLPIENLGIEPDIPYSLTVEDFTQNYEPYCRKILEAIEFLLTEEI